MRTAEIERVSVDAVDSDGVSGAFITASSSSMSNVGHFPTPSSSPSACENYDAKAATSPTLTDGTTFPHQQPATGSKEVDDDASDRRITNAATVPPPPPPTPNPCATPPTSTPGPIHVAPETGPPPPPPPPADAATSYSIALAAATEDTLKVAAETSSWAGLGIAHLMHYMTAGLENAGIKSRP